MSKIKLHHVFQYEDNSHLEFTFLGSASEQLLAKEQTEQLLNNLFSSRKKAPSIIDTVTILKNAFRQIDEDILEVYIYKEEELMRGVFYYQNKLNLYSYHKSPTENDPLDIEIEYYQKKGVKLTTNGVLNSEEELLQCQAIFSKEIDYLRKLANIKPHLLSDKEKTICKFYHLFYQENPNFSKSEDRIKAQSMLAFLTEFNITLYGLEGPDLREFYSFNLRENHQMVMSLDLTRDLTRLASLGEIPKESCEVKLASWIEKTIELVGQEIRKNMCTKENPTDWFKEVVKINHIKKYCLYSHSTSEDIALYGKSEPETVQKALSLVKRIDNKVEKACF